MEKIKVVIWDLDETFWEGTLSEGEIQYSDRNHQIVLELAHRGIVSTICSKNDATAARAMLESHGIWEYFVFRDIRWEPKGERIARTLDRMKLRPANALFLDDNPMNLQEARFYSPELRTASPECLDSLLDDPSLRGKEDATLSRLDHYRILEQKHHDQAESRTTNEDFLRGSEIVVEVGHDPLRHLDRIAELVERTNQLNYTKRRSDRTELQALLTLPEVDAGYLRVRDRYGDYGICAFYARRHGELAHFLFSCRILDMGVERWLYRELDFPSLDVSGAVAAPLPTPGSPPDVDWIRAATPTPTSTATGHDTPRPRVLLKGGCDLEQVKDFLGRDHLFDTELNTVGPDGVPVHREHTELLRQCSRAADLNSLLTRIPFLDPEAFQTRLFDGVHDAYIFSPLMDYTQGLYRHGRHDVVIPYGDHQLDITRTTNWPRLLGPSGPQGISEEFLEWFAAEFRFEGGISEDRFRDNLRWLCQRIGDSPLILLNGAEIPLEHELERQRHRHHHRLNAVVDAVVGETPHAFLCDVRPLVHGPEDVTNNIRHYRRMIYHDIAEELRRLISEQLEVRFSRLQGVVQLSKVVVGDTLKKAAKKLLR